MCSSDLALLPALDSGRDSGVISLNGHLALGVAAPIEMPDLVGWLVLAQPLDQKDLQSLSRLSAIPMAVDVQDARMLSPSLRAQVTGQVAIAPGSDGDDLVRLSDLPSLQQGVAPRLVLRSSLDKAMEAYTSVRSILLAIVVVGTLLGVWLASHLAVGITQIGRAHV